MAHSRSARRTLASLLAVLLAAPLPAAAQVDCPTAAAPPFLDNRDGHFVNFEEAPNHPMERSSDGRKLFVANVPDGRVSVWDLTAPGNPVLIDEVPVGLGPVTIRRRPAKIALPTAPTSPTVPLMAAQATSAIVIGEPQPVPLSRQVWVVCMSSNAIFILDEASHRVIDSVRLTGRPSGLVFDAAGDTAYVTLTDTNEVAKLNANLPHGPAVRIPFDSEMPLGGVGTRVDVEEPRALLRDGDDLYVLSFLSGNGSTGFDQSLADPVIFDQWEFSDPPESWPIPPDRDVLRFDLAAPGTPAGSAALWRMGTLNFDLAKGPNGHLYVTTVDLANVTHSLATGPLVVTEGEPHYRLNGFAVHAIAHAAPSAAGTPQAGTVVVDLNDPARHGPNLPADFRCAVPTDLLIAPDGRAFVACYETRNVAQLDLATDKVVAEFRITGTSGFGLRGLALSADGRWLYAYGRGDNTKADFDTQGLVPGVPRAPVRVRSNGFDITPQRVKDGRRRFLDAANSADGLSTCNTCHLDGHLDGIAWDLSDFTGDLATDAEDVPRVPKGAKVTMSLLGIEETPPFHWRGDRADLDAFDPAFEGLLGGTRLDDPQDPDDPELAEFMSFVFSLSYPPSPHQPLDRSYSADALTGFDCFVEPAVHDVSDTTATVISPSCEDCHSLTRDPATLAGGSSGTLNQVNNPIVGLLADDATQLRGLWDKSSERVDYAPVATCPQAGNPYCGPFLQVIPATGWGIANTGFVDRPKDFVALGVFDLTGDEEDRIVDLLDELDTGSAPTTAATHQISAGLTTGPPWPTPVAELVAGADPLDPTTPILDNDLIARGWIRHQGAVRRIGMLWVARDGTGAPFEKFVTDTIDNPAAGCAVDAQETVGANGIGPFSLQDLAQKVRTGDAVLALVGTPVGSGYRLGLDREMDCLRDGDEAAHGASISTPDTDRDGFPDGHEVRLGSLPDSNGSTPTDTVAPAVAGAAIAWHNSNVVKVRWATDEEARSRIRVYDVTAGPPGTLVFENDEPQFKRAHGMVARKLEPDRDYRVELVATDPANLATTFNDPALEFTTRDHLFESVHLASTTLTRLSTNPNGTERYLVRFHVVQEDGANADGAVVSFQLAEWHPGGGAACTSAGGGGCAVRALATAPSNALGIASAEFDGELPFAAAHGFAEAFVASPAGVTFPPPSTETRLYFHSLDGQFGHWDQEELYPPP